MDYAFASLAFAATLLATIGKVTDKDLDKPIYRRINAIGWVGVALALCTLGLQLYKGASSARKDRQVVEAALQSVFARSVALGSLGADFEHLSRIAAHVSSKSLLESTIAGRRTRLGSHRQSADVEAVKWKDALPSEIVRALERVTLQAGELSVHVQSDTWSPDMARLHSERLQAAAMELNASLCAASAAREFQLIQPVLASPCSKDGKEWLSASELEDSANESVLRLFTNTRAAP